MSSRIHRQLTHTNVYHWRRTRVSVGMVAVLLLLSITATEADTVIDKKLAYAISVTITGPITERDAQIFESASKDFDYIAPTVWLDSPGGSVSAALKIGRLIRKHEGTTFITGKCYSSCALIFIAGVTRIIPSDAQALGLHRPYLAEAPRSREDLEKSIPMLLAMVKNYVSEMGITEHFYEQMVNTEPSRMVIYTEANYENLVPRLDPVFDEIRVAYEARKYGIATDEFRKREQETKRCGNVWNAKSETCAAAIKWGLSETVYLERKTQAKGSCTFTFEEAQQKIPYKLKRDDPVTIRCEANTRKIMLGH